MADIIKVHQQEKRNERKEKTMPFGVNLMRSQVLNRAAQVHQQYCAACPIGYMVATRGDGQQPSTAASSP